MDCRHLDDIYELYLLGLLTDEEAEGLGDHLKRDCPYCLARLREASETVFFFLTALSKGRPSQKAKAAILKRISRKP